MRHQLNSFVISAVLILTGGQAQSFSSFQSDGGNMHEQITREALTGTISDTNVDFIVKACNSQDEPGEDGLKEPRRHFDDSQFVAALAYVDREKKKALNYAGEADTDAESRAHCLRHFGLMLHTVQDFYSRTNFVEIQMENPAVRGNPYGIEVVDWAKVPAGYTGAKSGNALQSGRRSGEKHDKDEQPQNAISFEEINKDNAESAEGKKAVGGSTYFKVARDLAVRETQRQWNLFEALIRGRFQQRAQSIITAIKQASPAAGQMPD